MRLWRLLTIGGISLSLLFGRDLAAQYTINLINFFKYDQNVQEYYRKIETLAIARQIAVTDKPLGEQVLALENSKDFQIAFNNELIDALKDTDDFMRHHQIKTMLVDLVAKTYPQVPQILSRRSAEMVMAEQETEVQAFAGDAPHQFARLKGRSTGPDTWLTSVTDSPLGSCMISSDSGRMKLTCIPEQSGFRKDDLVALYERTRDSIARSLATSIADKHDQNSQFHLMRITTFTLKNGTEVEVGVVGDDRTGVDLFFRAPK